MTRFRDEISTKAIRRHSELSPVLQFTSDLRIAFARKHLSHPFPWEAESTLVRVEVSSEERKAESLGLTCAICG